MSRTKFAIDRNKRFSLRYVVSGTPAGTPGVILIDLGEAKDGTDASGLADDATAYTADFNDGTGADNISIVGSAAQTIADVVTELNADLSDWTAAHSDGERYITLTQDTAADSSVPTLADTGGDGLLAGLSATASNASAGIDPFEDISIADYKSGAGASADDVVFVASVRTSANQDKSGIRFVYRAAEDVIRALDGSSATLADGDVIEIIGEFYYN